MCAVCASTGERGAASAAGEGEASTSAVDTLAAPFFLGMITRTALPADIGGRFHLGVGRAPHTLLLQRRSNIFPHFRHRCLRAEVSVVIQY